MGITYTDEKKFTKEQTQQLFRSVGWGVRQISGTSVQGSDGIVHRVQRMGRRPLGRLGARAHDTEMVAYMHYVLVDPEYQGHGIAGHLVGMVKERYRDYLYIEVMPEESKNATFYQKHGFSIMEDGAAMQIRNPGERR